MTPETAKPDDAGVSTAIRTIACLLFAVMASLEPLSARDEPPPPPAAGDQKTEEAPAEKADTTASEATEAAAARGDDGQEPAPEMASADPQAGPKASLKIETDLDCMVTVAPDPAQKLAPGTVLEIEVPIGTIEVRATAVEASEAQIVESFTLEEGERQRVKLKMAKALSELRKLEARERTYRDIETRLMWPTADNGSDVTWVRAGKICDDLKHGGWEDWRLPTVEELDGLQQMWSQRAFKTPDPITLTSCCPWSSERIDAERAWNYNFRFRRPFEGHVNYSYDLRALCVRDGSDEIPENTRKNRREAKRQAKERKREKARAETEAEAADSQEESSDGR